MKIDRRASLNRMKRRYEFSWANYKKRVWLFYKLMALYGLFIYITTLLRQYNLLGPTTNDIAFVTILVLMVLFVWIGSYYVLEGYIVATKHENFLAERQNYLKSIKGE